MKVMQKYLFIILGVLLSITLASCGGSSTSSGSGSGSGSSGSDDTIPTGSTDVQALKLSENLSLVSGKSGNTSLNQAPALKTAFLTLFAASDLPDDSEYKTDVADIYVHDKNSSEVLSFINELLCYFNQTAYDKQTNKGPYKALVETSKCSRHDDKSSQEGNKSSGKSKTFETWLVNSGRADTDSPQRVHFKVYAESGEEMGPSADRIYGNLTVTTEPSTSNPYGVFNLQFIGKNSDGTASEFSGYINASVTDDGFNDLKVYMNESDLFTMSGHVILDPNDDEGEGIVSFSMSFDEGSFGEGEGPEGGAEEGDFVPNTMTFSSSFAFDANFYLTSFDDMGVSGTMCNSRTQFNSNVWEYGLYNSTTGDRIEPRVGGKSLIRTGSNGEKQYWWLDYWGLWGPENATNGMEFIDENTGETWKAVVGAGRFLERTREQKTLSDFENVKFLYWDSETGEEIKVMWDGTQFVKVATQTCDENGCSFQDAGNTPISFTNTWLGFWKDGLGAVDVVLEEGEDISGTTKVYVTTEEVHAPGTGEFTADTVTLHCYYDCPDPDNLTSNNPFFPDKEEGQGSYQYTFDVNKYTLSFDNKSITVATNTNQSFGAFSDGVWSGPMVTTELDQPWKVWDQATSYNWETGPNSWNKYLSAVDTNGNPAEFDEPLYCDYTHPSGEYAGPYQLEYTDSLWGIPWVQVGTGFQVWTQAFTIPDGEALACNDGNTYYVRALAMEQVPLELDISNCDHLEASDVANASADDFEIFDTDMIDAYEDKLSSDKPTVIEGKVQTTTTSS